MERSRESAGIPALSFALPGALGLRPSRVDRRLLLLGLVAVVAVVIYMTIDVDDWAFSLPLRGRKVAAMLLVSFAIAYSTVIFQTVTNNRILTPSIIGFDALYVLIQTAIVFLFGGLTYVVIHENLMFLLNVGLMILFAGLLYRWLFGREGSHLYFLVLVGVIFGTLFANLSNFMQKMLDPNEFTILQNSLFAGMGTIDETLLVIAAALVVLITLFSLRYARYLDVLSLGRDVAINLGVDHTGVVNRLMIVIAVLVSVSTALVGPITFLGLLVANLAVEFLPTYRHSQLIPAAVLVAIVALVGGQLLIERVFAFSTTLSVVINFTGGIYFLALLLRQANRTEGV